MGVRRANSGASSAAMDVDARPLRETMRTAVAALELLTWRSRLATVSELVRGLVDDACFSFWVHGLIHGSPMRYAICYKTR